MQQMLPDDLQVTNERRFSKKHLDTYVRAHLENPEHQERIELGVKIIKNWIAGSYYDSKQVRLAQLNKLDLHELVTDIFVGIAYCQTETLFVDVTGQLAYRLHFDDHKDAITTVAELVAILEDTGVYQIVRYAKGQSLYVQSLAILPEELIEAWNRSRCLPPMVTTPKLVTSNWESAYYTFNDSVMCGKQKGHDGNLCLDVINKQNNIPLRLSIEFLKTVEEQPTSLLTTREQLSNWQEFKIQSYETYTLIAAQGNLFYEPHKVDKRGRLYTVAYHINSQGTPFKKAMIELANREVVEGVPT